MPEKNSPAWTPTMAITFLSAWVETLLLLVDLTCLTVVSTVVMPTVGARQVKP